MMHCFKKMEFVLVTRQDNIKDRISDMRILSIPVPLMVFCACKDKHEFVSSIVHRTFDFDYTATLLASNYCSVNGSLVFRHSVTFRTAVISFVSQKILIDSGKIVCCIDRIHNIAWQDDDDICEFIGILEAKLRLRVLPYMEVMRNDARFYAVATSDLTMRAAVKEQLKFLRCEFGVNVAFRKEHGARTRRSTLFPITLINPEEIPHDGLYSIITMKPEPTSVLCSANQKHTFGCPYAGKEGRRNLEDHIAQYHTASVMKRIRSECIPRMHAMEAGEVYTPRLEFKTPTGPRMYDVIIRNIGRACMIVVFKEHKPFREAAHTLKERQPYI
jgi:hypothetical protein